MAVVFLAFAGGKICKRGSNHPHPEHCYMLLLVLVVHIFRPCTCSVDEKQ